MSAAKPLVDSPAPDTVSRAVRRQDDNDRFCRRFAELTGMEVKSASTEGLPAQFLAHLVPPPRILLARYGSTLAARTFNALSRYDPRPDEPPFTFRRLLELRGFGLFSLIDLLEAMSRPPEPAADNSPLT